MNLALIKSKFINVSCIDEVFHVPPQIILLGGSERIVTHKRECEITHVCHDDAIGVLLLMDEGHQMTV